MGSRRFLRRKPGHGAEKLYGLDLAGAWAEAMGVAILLVPSWGDFHTYLLIKALEGVSLICLRLASHQC